MSKWLADSESDALGPVSEGTESKTVDGDEGVASEGIDSGRLLASEPVCQGRLVESSDADRDATLDSTAQCPRATDGGQVAQSEPLGHKEAGLPQKREAVGRCRAKSSEVALELPCLLVRRAEDGPGAPGAAAPTKRDGGSDLASPGPPRAAAEKHLDSARTRPKYQLKRCRSPGSRAWR